MSPSYGFTMLLPLTCAEGAFDLGPVDILRSC